MKASRSGDLIQDDLTQFTQFSDDQDTQGLATTSSSFNSEEPQNPTMADLTGTHNQVNDMSFFSNVSGARQGLSNTTTGDSDGPRQSRKRGREGEPEGSARRTKRGGKKHN